jgi:hypothetical protein
MGHAHPEAKRGRDFKKYIAVHSTRQSIGCRTPKHQPCVACYAEAGCAC